MSGNLTDVAESLALNYLTVNTNVAPSTGLQLRLMTANGSDSAAGTEVTGGSYAGQNITLSASSGGSACSNGSDITFTGMPACTVVGMELWDRGGTPRRLWYGAATASKAVNAGDDYKVAAGDLSVSMD